VPYSLPVAVNQNREENVLTHAVCRTEKLTLPLLDTAREWA
jgi:hypothetical protein